MKFTKLKYAGKVLTNKEQKAVKGGRGCSCSGNPNGNGGNNPPCHEC